MVELRGMGFPWVVWRTEPDRRHQKPASVRWWGVACPHCTNTDTLVRHCTNPACRWVRCTCGALVYSRRRHRHPRHGSGHDTCHAPWAAA